MDLGLIPNNPSQDGSAALQHVYACRLADLRDRLVQLLLDRQSDNQRHAPHDPGVSATAGSRLGSGRIISISEVAGTSVWVPALTHGLNNLAMATMRRSIWLRISRQRRSPSTQSSPDSSVPRRAKRGPKTWPSSRGNQSPNFSANSAGRWESCRDDGRRWTRSPVPWSSSPRIGRATLRGHIW